MSAAEMEFVVDEEFEALLPELTDEEHHLLKESLLAEGCHDPVMIWQGQDILLDGHNRVVICDEHDIAYGYEAIDLPDRDAAKVWIVKNARARRNLTPDKISYLRGLQYSLEKKPEGRPPKELGHSDQVTTSESLAEEHNVGEKTIRRDAEYATAVDELAENVGPEIKQQILSGDARLTKKDVVAIAELPKAEQKKVIKDHLGGNKKAVKEATTEAAPETSYPVSAKFSHSLNFISGFCTGLRNDHKTVAKVLKHKQWDKSRTAELARMLDAVTRSLTSLNTEMQSHVNGAET